MIGKRISTLKQQESKNTETTVNNDIKPKMAFLDTLLSTTINGRHLTTQEVYDEVTTFIFEGHDTITSGICFALYLLSRHLEIQQKVFEEQLRIIQGNFKRDATFQELTEMPYLDLVLKETERLYPSVPIIGRKTEKDYMISK